MLTTDPRVPCPLSLKPTCRTCQGFSRGTVYVSQVPETKAKCVGERGIVDVAYTCVQTCSEEREAEGKPAGCFCLLAQNSKKFGKFKFTPGLPDLYV